MTSEKFLRISPKIKILIGIILSISIISDSHADQPSLLVYDQKKNSQESLHNFRDLSIIGLNAIASEQFSEQQLESIKKKYQNQKIIIVDLRREDHGFINGKPVSLYGEFNQSNNDENVSQIIEEEEEFFGDIKKQPRIIINKVIKLNDDETWPESVKPEINEVASSASEEELARKYGFGYQRFAIKDHHPPTRKELEEYADFIRNLPADTKLYVHCKAGHGRTSTFLAVYDIIKNAKNKSLSQIIDQQHKLGGANLSKLEDFSQIKSKLKKERFELVKDFYTITASTKISAK